MVSSYLSVSNSTQFQHLRCRNTRLLQASNRYGYTALPKESEGPTENEVHFWTVRRMLDSLPDINVNNQVQFTNRNDAKRVHCTLSQRDIPECATVG